MSKCASCGKRTPKGNTYCRNCKDKIRNNVPLKPKARCLKCGKQYEKNTKGQRYCSEECNRKSEVGTLKHYKNGTKTYFRKFDKDKLQEKLVQSLVKIDAIREVMKEKETENGK